MIHKFYDIPDMIAAAYRLGVARGGATIAGYFLVDDAKAKDELRALLEEFPAPTQDELLAEAARYRKSCT